MVYIALEVQSERHDVKELHLPLVEASSHENKLRYVENLIQIDADNIDGFIL